MFISKTAFNNLNQFLQTARHNSVELAKLVQELRDQLAKKDDELAALKKQRRFYTTHWVTICCPSCNHEFTMHTMKEE